MGMFELEYRYLDYKAVSEGDVLLEFRVQGVRYDSWDNAFEGGGGVGSVVRVRMSRNNPEEQRRIEATELVPSDDAPNKSHGVPGIDNGGKKSLAGSDWGGRRDVSAGIWADWTFIPEEWNDYGRKDEHWRQFLCRLEDLGMNLTGFIVTCVLLGVSSLRAEY